MSLFDSTSNVWCIEHATRAGLLIDARDYYRAFHETAAAARRSILIAGWQFDSNVRLLRGDDVPPGATANDVELLTFLDGLCEASPELRIDILAWDFSVVYALERELWQKYVFDFRTNERFRFRFDSQCPVGASHHQKFVVVDDEVAFLGGTDLCEHRWDDRSHRLDDPRRTLASGAPYTPFHEVQAYVTGPAARRLTELFAVRWCASGGEPIPEHTPAPAGAPHLAGFPSRPSVSFPEGPLALSRTRPACSELARSGDAALAAEARECHEIAALMEDAILSAERLLYIETQYLTSRALLQAFLRRFADASRPALEVVLVLPREAEELKEKVAVGIAQAKVLERLVAAAKAGGHALGVYNVASRGASGEDVYEYIHAKVLVADDRFVTLGSANLTNRSMGLDTELNVSWEAPEGKGPLATALHDARVSLLAEHVGLDDEAGVDGLRRPEGLVARLDAFVREGRGRLRHHDLRPVAEPAIFAAIGPDATDLLDPEGPALEERLDAHLGSTLRDLVTGRVARAWATFVQSSERGE